MEDKEIVKALEDWIKNYDGSYVNFKTLGNTFDLINRLQARVDDLERDELPKCKDALKRANVMGLELEKEKTHLQAENERLKGIKTTDWLVKGISKEQLEKEKIEAIHENAYKLGKAEAYKECIEKAKSEIDRQSHSRSLEASGERFRIHKILDNLLKELAGEDNASKN